MITLTGQRETKSKVRKPGSVCNPEELRFDMHIHSCYSADSSIPVNTIVGSYNRTGILPLVCDHNSIAGSERVYDILCKNDPDLPYILAEEIMTSDGEIIGVFLNEEIPKLLMLRRPLMPSVTRERLRWSPIPSAPTGHAVFGRISWK